MTRIDFYILDAEGENERLGFACRLAEKIYRSKAKLHIHTENPATQGRLDELLWTFRAGSFLPHRLLDGTPDGAPIVIGFSEPEATEPDWQVLMNLAGSVPDFFSRFERVAEVVDSSEEARAKARERYRFYQTRGYPLTTHKL